MATLKSIKNKYLSASDGDVLGVTTNTENVSLLSLKLATADSLSKFNLVDGFSDDYQDATGVDAGGSTNETRDSTGKYYSGTVIGPILNAYTSGSGNFTAPAGVTSVEVLVVAAGGGGGGMGGGGGAGGVVHHTGYTVVPSSTYAYSVGTGGSGVAYNAGVGGTGGNSTFGTGTVMTAVGGGGGSGGSADGADGGSGGGANGGYANVGAGGSDPGDGTQADSGGGTGYGNNAGAGERGDYFGGGGGGADAVGGDADGYGGAGGAGKLFSSFVAYGTTSGNVASSGSNGGYFGGGGGGGGYNSSARGTPGGGGLAGVGGGAQGEGSTTGPTSTITNTGGGGAGVRDNTGGNGATGIVIVRQADSYTNMTLASDAYTAQAAPTTARIILDEYTSTGSATLNTDIKAYASRDNGTTYTQMTLADQGTIETNHRLLSGSVDISGQPSGTSVKYKIETLNQSASKITRVYGTSMAWA